MQNFKDFRCILMFLLLLICCDLAQQVQLLGEKPKYANARPVITIEEFIPIFVEGSGDEAQTKAPSFPQYFHLSRDTSPLHSRQTSSAPLSSPTVSSQSWFAVSSLLYKQSTNVIKRMGMRGALSPPRTPRSYSSLSLLYSNFVATTHLFRETLLNTTRSPHSSAGPTASAGLTATSIRTRKPSSGRSPEAGDEYKAGEIKDSLNSRREGNTISSAERSWTHAQMSTTVRVPSTLIVSATQRSSETSRGSTQARAVQELFTPKLKSIENATQGGTLRQSSAHETSPTVESTANLMPIAPISTSSELVRSSDNEDERKPAISLHYIHSTSFEHLPGSLSTAPVMHSTETPNTEESTHTTRTPEPEATMSMYTPSDEVKTINSRQEVQTDTTPTSVTSMIILNKITSEVTVSRESKPCDRSEGRDKIAILTQNEGNTIAC